MKFGIKMYKDQVESMEQIVGTTCDGVSFGRLFKSDGASEDYGYFCCTGSFGAYLRAKRFFGKDQVGKWNW